jgi:hypothetical protein
MLNKDIQEIHQQKAPIIDIQVNDTNFFLILCEKTLTDHAGVAQLVEFQLPKLNVAGSNPVSRSLIKLKLIA